MLSTRTFLISTALLAGFCGAASADVSYVVTIDTSSLSGTGGIYISFAPGFDSDPASVSITNFTPNSVLAGAPAFTDGGVTGTLDSSGAPLVMTNYLQQLNDYGEYLTLGSVLQFDVTFSLPPVLLGSSGSELDVQIDAADLATPLLTADPSGNIVAISYDNTGAFTTLVTNPAVATITPFAQTPEPESRVVLAFALLAVAAVVRSRRAPAV
jgi:hypothetical protein